MANGTDLPTMTSAPVGFSEKRYNTLPRAYGWIEETLKKDPDIIENLIGDTLRYGNKGTIKCIGYLLSQLGIAHVRLLALK